MSDQQKPPTLLDPEARGGDNAESGFDFQDSLIVARIPEWLASDGFTSMIREAMADTEARFFQPSAGLVCEFVEYKNHSLPPGDFWKEMLRFQEMDAGHPTAYIRFTLVCPAVSEAVATVLNALHRVREVFPFYDSAPTIQDASYQAYVAAVRKAGQDDTMAAFVFAKVVVDDAPPKRVEHTFDPFRGRLEQHFPAFSELGRKESEAAWHRLRALVAERRAKPIERHELESVIFAGHEALQPGRIRLYTGSESLPSRWEITPELRLDWSRFSGTDGRQYPLSDAWKRDIVDPLAAIRDWIVDTKRVRRIALSGQRRLSASVAIGTVFAAVRGFGVDFDYRGAIWSTDDHAGAETPAYPWKLERPAGSGSDLVVAIGILRDPTPEVRTFLANIGLQAPLLSIWGDGALESAKHTNRAVQGAKAAIADALASTRARTMHLFLAVPAHFALFLGHRLNATAVVWCYERTAPGEYQLTCVLDQS